ncbi:MAG: hypothetical protein LBU84_06775 [Prevotella sp.]|jgi:hypothetical protein|nr:hypothetical protein [Prevotella sp.]
MSKRQRNRIKRKKQKRHHSPDCKRYRNSRRGVSASSLKRAKKRKSPREKSKVKKKIGSSKKTIAKTSSLLIEEETRKSKAVSKSGNKREKIFNAYVKNLNFLIDNRFVTGEKDKYICPIDLKSHNNIDDPKDPLALEDAPPKSLGGSANTLTCKSCNNTCGTKIDSHLVKRMREIDDAKFLPNTETKVQVKIGDDTFQGTLKIEADGTLKMIHSNKNNNPSALKDKMENLEEDMVVDINFIKSNVIPENLEFALLKTAYLIFFEKFGYSLIFDKCYDIVRDQLQHPEKRVYPAGFWFKPPFPKTMEGVYFVCDKGLESILALFSLDTGKTETMFGVFLPLPIHSIEDVIDRLNKTMKEKKSFPLMLYPLEQKRMNYLSDKQNISSMYQWIDERKEIS